MPSELFVPARRSGNRQRLLFDEDAFSRSLAPASDLNGLEQLTKQVERFGRGTVIKLLGCEPRVLADYISHQV